MQRGGWQCFWEGAGGRFRDWQDCGITGLTIWGDESALRLMAQLAELAPMVER